MESRNELKEIGIKNRTYYYFADIKRIRELEILVLGIVNRDIYRDIYIYIYIILYIFITFHTNHTKLSWIQNHCVLGLVK